MIQECALIILIFFQITTLPVNTNEIPFYNFRQVGEFKPHSILTNIERIYKQNCLFSNKWSECTAIIKIINSVNNFKRMMEEKILPYYNSGYNSVRRVNTDKPFFPEPQPVYRRIYLTNPTRIMNIRPLPYTYTLLPAKTYELYRPGMLNPRTNVMHDGNTAWNMPHLSSNTSSGLKLAPQSTQVNSSSTVALGQFSLKPPLAMVISGVPRHKNISSIEKFIQSLDHFERQFYKVTFTKLTTISPTDRQVNGMSFVQSGFLLLLTLMTLSREVDSDTRDEIDKCIGFTVSDMENIEVVRHFMSTLPNSSDKLKFRQSSRLMLWPGKQVSQRFQSGVAAALMLQVEWFNGTETSDTITTILNQKVEADSGGAIHDTFDEDDVSGGVTAVLMTTLYVRGSWRVAPTVLNGTRPFRDAEDAPKRTVRMIKINDIMKYADLKEWNAQAIEISYATPGLTLLMLIPRDNTLNRLVHHVSDTSIETIIAKMETMRVAATVPIYTLRMTLLLPNKLQDMGIRRLVEVGNMTKSSSLRLSHAVQRIMFWAEAGRNAYKDDGIEWDEAPQLEVVVDRPYIFFVRWRNVTLINGNFVL